MVIQSVLNKYIQYEINYHGKRSNTDATSNVNFLTI